MSASLFDLSGLTALVTGGGSGLGRDIAEVLAEHGANIAVCSRKLNNCQETVEFIKRKYPVNAKAYGCDVSCEEDVNRTVEAVSQKTSPMLYCFLQMNVHHL